MLESRPLQNPLGCSTNPPLNCLCPSASHHQLLPTLFYSSGLLMGLPASMLDLQSTPTEEPEQTCERSLLYSETSNSACPILPHVNTEDLLLAQDIYLAGPNSFPPSLTSLTSSPTLLHPHSPLDHFSLFYLRAFVLAVSAQYTLPPYSYLLCSFISSRPLLQSHLLREAFSNL